MKIAIIGTAPTSRALAPYSDPEWEIWACSSGNQGLISRCNAWFEIHAIVDLESPENQAWSMPYLKWLSLQSFKIVMQEANQYVPKADVYPIHEMIRQFGRNYFSSSIAYMIALAISQMKAGDEIGIFGVDMAAEQEHYSSQKLGCIHFMELARAKGIKIVIPRESCLGNPPPLYGYGDATPFGRRMAATEVTTTAALQSMIAQRDKTSLEIAYFQGAMEQVRYIKRTWIDGVNDSELDVAADIRKAAHDYAERAYSPPKPIEVPVVEAPIELIAAAAKLNGAHAEGVAGAA